MPPPHESVESGHEPPLRASCFTHTQLRSGVTLRLPDDSIRFPLPLCPAARSAIAYRVRYFAVALVEFPLGASLASLRAQLTVGINEFEQNYNATVYGDPLLGSEQTLTINEAHDTLVFSPSCMRLPPTPCFPPTHPWYATTTNGLDTAVKTYIEEARLLVTDSLGPTPVSMNNSHLNYIWAVGKNDLGGGLDELLKLTYEDTLMYIETAQTMQIILLVVAFVINFLFFTRYFSPWLARTMGESKRVAHLLSDLPPELSVEKILAETFSTGEEKAGVAAADAS